MAQWSFTLLTLHRGETIATGGLMVSLYWGSLMQTIGGSVVVLTLALLTLYQVLARHGQTPAR